MQKTLFPLFLLLIMAGACHSSKKTTEVVKPVYHKTWPTNTHVVNVRVLGKRFKLLKRKRTEKVSMQ
jgi:hypothetical protein